MDPLLVWGIALLAISAVILVIELFVPSGGMLGITAAVVAVAGVVCLWRYDTTAGISGTLAVLVLGPLAFSFMLKIWPHTPMGRRLINAPTEEEQMAQRQIEEQEKTKRLALVGKEGTALTDLRPVGLVEIAGHRYEVLSETHFIPTASKVRVTHADLAQIKVRQA